MTEFFLTSSNTKFIGGPGVSVSKARKNDEYSFGAIATQLSEKLAVYKHIHYTPNTLTSQEAFATP